MATDAPSSSTAAGEVPVDMSGLVMSLEPDSSSDVSNSTLGDIGVSSITTSVASSAMEFRYENGRRYNAYAESKYALPNDDAEIDRLELQHMIWSEVLNRKLHCAPLPHNMTDAIDIGCGTGAWAVDFANQYPNTKIIGVDLSPIQPQYVPLNVSFVIDDASNDWPEDYAAKFDYIHTRAIGMGISNWDRFIEQCFNSLKPGGWLELQEFHLPAGCDDGSLKPEHAFHKWGETLRGASAKFGIDIQDALKHPQRLRDRGFERVTELMTKTPVGPWCKGERQKHIGILMLKDLHENLAGISMKLFLATGMTPKEVEELCEGAKANIMNPRIHTFMPGDICWGQKPFESQAPESQEAA